MSLQTIHLGRLIIFAVGLIGTANFAIAADDNAATNSAPAKVTSGNPIFSGWYADPEAKVFSKEYWVYPTYSAPYNQQTFFDAFSSPDLVHWTKHPHVFGTNKIAWAHRAMWAPAVAENHGRYYFFFAANDIQNDQQVGGLGIAVADQPGGPFKDYLGKPLIDKFHNGAQPIDPFVFRDNDGQYYLTYGGWGHCNICRLKDDFTGIEPFADGTEFKEITPKGYVEGSVLFRRGDKYYFMWSEGGWTGPDYSVAYAIADAPTGPFKRIGKILQQDPQVATGAGHHSVIHVPGTDDYYIVYHRRPLGEMDGNHRVTCIDRMEFDKNGFIQPVKITFEGVSAQPLVSAEVTYKNPVIPGDHPDPSIIRVGEDYWATCTSSAWGPMFPLLHSRDLVNWEQTGAVLPHRPDWATGDFWAPEISEFNGKFFVYFVARQGDGRLAVAVATANQPDGPYTDHGPMIAQPDGSIDPAPVVDTNGVRYLVWKEDGNSQNKPTPIWLQRLSDDGTKLVDAPHELIHNDADWEGSLVEGPFILRRDRWFYLFYSGNGCCGAGCHYALGVARSRSLFGPWEKNPLNPILAGNETWKCPGHGSIVQDGQRRCFFLYHAYSTTGMIFTGREAMLDEVKFGADGWPTINDGNGPSVSAASPFAIAQKETTAASFSDNFVGDKLDSGWQWPQQREPRYRQAGGKLHLAAKDNQTNLLSSVLARSTTALDYDVTTAVETPTLPTNAAAGLCAMGDLDNAVGAVVQDGNIVVWRRDQGQIHELSRQPAPAGDKIFLRLEARQGFHFQFAASADGEHWTPCGNVADAKNLPPWDRAVRVALTIGGAAGAGGVFDSFYIRPLERH